MSAVGTGAGYRDVMDTRVAAYVVLRNAVGSVLLCRWRRGRRAAWTLPGGGVEFGERPDDAARREVREETGLRVAIGAPLGSDSRVVRASRRMDGGEDDLHQIRLFYQASASGGRLRAEPDGPIERVQWFPLHALPAHRFSIVDAALGHVDLPPEAMIPDVDQGMEMTTPERWERRNAQVRVNGYGVIVQDGQVLLSRWADRAAWTLTGGQVDPGESPEDAAARFTLAETGFRIELGPVRWIDSRVHPPWSQRAHPQQAISLYADARIVDGELTLPDPEVTQTDLPAWFPVDALPPGTIREVVAALTALGYPARRAQTG